MRTHTCVAQVLILCSLLICSCEERSTPSEATKPVASNEKVLRILGSMVDGSWEGRSLPQLDWQDVDALLARADSTTDLKSFPANPLSSQAQFSCPEGIMALWLVESMRNKAKSGYPSLNPLCLGAQNKDMSWEEMSKANLAKAAQAYRSWWQKVKDQDEEKRKEVDPLEAAHLHWY